MEDLWKNTEFTVLSHGDTKDVFTLGGTDDIQVVMSCTFMQSIVKHHQCFSISKCLCFIPLCLFMCEGTPG